MSRLSKQQFAGKLAKKTVTVDEKIKFLDFAKKNPKLGCRKLADILKNEKKICKLEMLKIKET